MSMGLESASLAEASTADGASFGSARCYEEALNFGGEERSVFMEASTRSDALCNSVFRLRAMAEVSSPSSAEDGRESLAADFSTARRTMVA